MSIDTSEKLKLMRESERLNRRQLSELTEIPYSSLSSYESGSKEISMKAVKKLFSVPQFSKYMMWFLTDKVAPESGQIAPALAHFGQENGDSFLSGQKIG
ncbi:helix-turn-helix domain-containing protein [Aeromonas veronii]|uniref:helix-turn-helix domain-containing protein n=2 Tax=Aeromonas TaxID=642 RepID=UPI0007185D45|nr:helix-turn-helix domain-containing protein [Aeromonas caviae]KRV65289.1 repressor [Aeromonas veronii]MBL0626541.1 helix-turn-helix domain-containing protein [Aeromonas jandaei]HCT2506477.1 helix-turn-helix domain-containing protein [Aeromonas dhakensis]KRV75202.1 repressor [Aeromonas veronii]KRV83068.1 repressor [Aeromonas veronii]